MGPTPINDTDRQNFEKLFMRITGLRDLLKFQINFKVDLKEAWLE